jgi:sugar phosphate isomerase/epimerase
MLIGAMNHPAMSVISEIAWMHELDFDFVDLTLEPPAAMASRVNADEIRRALEAHGLQVVGHTAYYLPIASAFESVRRAAVEEMKVCLEMFAKVGAGWMNLHPDRHAPFHDRGFVIERNLRSISELMKTARDCGVGLMIENLPGHFNTVAQLAELLEPLALHLDIGHCNLLTEYNTADEIIRAFGPRLKHVHLHDNKGGSADLHLPLGTGNIDLRRHISALRQAGYDSTITLEVFSVDKSYLEYSRKVLMQLWEDAALVTARAA